MFSYGAIKPLKTKTFVPKQVVRKKANCILLLYTKFPQKCSTRHKLSTDEYSEATKRKQKNWDWIKISQMAQFCPKQAHGFFPFVFVEGILF